MTTKYLRSRDVGWLFPHPSPSSSTATGVKNGKDGSVAVRPFLRRSPMEPSGRSFCRGISWREQSWRLAAV